MNSLARILLTALLMLCVVSFAHAKRVALVMGNDNYTAVTKLQKAGNDADAMARELRAAGFTVQLQKNLNYRSMVRVVESFANGITGGDEVVVFFAGHGVQIRSGSYLLPIDIEADSESQVEKTAYGINDLTEKLSEAKAAFALVVIDACRDNPLKTKGRSIGATRGLSAVEPAKGQMIVYSASRGQQALDRLNDRDPSPNGVFTREFIARMKKPGVRIEDMVREVQDAVETLAKTVSHEQRPALYNEARGNFYFYGPTTVQVAPQSNAVPEMTQAQKEEKFWDDAKAAGNKEAYEAYLESYPKGRYVSLARANIRRLSAVITQVPSIPIVTSPIIRPQAQALGNSGGVVKDCGDCTEIDGDTVEKRQRLIEEYNAKIQAKLYAGMARFADLPDTIYAELEVTVLPDGNVISTKITKKSTITAFDEAAERAVLRAQPLPVPRGVDAQLFAENFRRMRLVFRPQQVANSKPSEDIGAFAASVEERRRVREMSTDKKDDNLIKSTQFETEADRAKRIGPKNSFVFDPAAGGGMFQIKRISLNDAEVAFHGWNKEIRRKTLQILEISKGDNPDIRLAVVRRLIAVIRDYESSDFQWESRRLGGVQTLSARPMDNARLEEFLLSEFFPDQKILSENMVDGVRLPGFNASNS